MCKARTIGIQPKSRFERLGDHIFHHVFLAEIAHNVRYMKCRRLQNTHLSNYDELEAGYNP